MCSSDLAQLLLRSGDHSWNSGMFIWKVETIMAEIEKQMPGLFHAVNEIVAAWNTPAQEEVVRAQWNGLKSQTIDYGIMEKAKNVYVLSAEFGWSDLGTWKSLYEELEHDAEGNAVVGKNVLLDKTSNCIVNLPDDQLAVLQGLENYIVVYSDNVLLICPKDDEQQVRNLVNDVKLKKGDKYI